MSWKDILKRMPPEVEELWEIITQNQKDLNKGMWLGEFDKQYANHLLSEILRAGEKAKKLWDEYDSDFGISEQLRSEEFRELHQSVNEYDGTAEREIFAERWPDEDMSHIDRKYGYGEHGQKQFEEAQARQQSNADNWTEQDRYDDLALGREIGRD